MASPTAVTLCKRFTNKYVPVVIGLRANNVRPYGVVCTNRWNVLSITVAHII